MRNVVFFLLIFVLASCSNNNPVERANELLNKKYPEIGKIERLDTIKGYQDAFSLFRSANRLQWRIDSILVARNKSGKSISLSEKNDMQLDLKIIYELQAKEARINLDYGLKGVNKEIVAFASSIKKGDVIYTVYFDKDISSIECIDVKR